MSVGVPASVSDDRGGVTVEAAFAVASLVSVAVLCAAGVLVVLGQLRCVDAAREAARLAARGDDRAAASAAGRVGPAGARLELRREGRLVVARVVADSALPGVAVSAESVALEEPGLR